MRMTDTFRKNLDRATERQKSRLREVTDKERQGWYDAGTSRMAADTSSMKPRDIDAVRDLMRNINPVRWRRMQSDYRWLQKQLEKNGLNAEDARYLY